MGDDWPPADMAGEWDYYDFAPERFAEVEDVRFYPNALEPHRLGLLLIVDHGGAASVIVDAAALERAVTELREERLDRLAVSASHNEPPEPVYLDDYCAGQRLWQRVRGWPEDWEEEPAIITEALAWRWRGRTWDAICTLTAKRSAFVQAVVSQGHADRALARAREDLPRRFGAMGLEGLPTEYRESLEGLADAAAHAEFQVEVARVEYRAFRASMAAERPAPARSVPRRQTRGWDDLARWAEDVKMVEVRDGFVPLLPPQAELVFQALAHLEGEREREYDLGLGFEDEEGWPEHSDALADAKSAVDGPEPGVQSTHVRLVVGALRLAAKEMGAGALHLNLGEYGHATAAQAVGLAEQLSGRN